MFLFLVLVCFLRILLVFKGDLSQGLSRGYIGLLGLLRLGDFFQASFGKALKKSMRTLNQGLSKGCFKSLKAFKKNV